MSPLVELLPATTVLAGVITLASTQVDERSSLDPELVFPYTHIPVPVAAIEAFIPLPVYVAISWRGELFVQSANTPIFFPKVPGNLSV